ncbi:MAG: hypothetical protein COW00_00935 [Bdellovibrio sp. CG12_big_fil_rev_8_21_14_0_65_39_13]|nr:MAG: hypothetical protein COW78_20525 [Bdellovibrio sp. CG22_combo_CG10-13_8_21_14_all_39_27]PIQ62820.1 MAG: hypothetical protein COW00_00935 [Bdellovibrio sp. CG12_big_fil_rev_8_21_14_0_65_39_13]PIR32523.1 MAG: hypothetical protein COV37_19485 [Bdellovibrio sp. CG11_big_fil_rev_8_21_14_0_20_39_38]
MSKVIVQILRAPAGGIRKHVYDILEHLSHQNDVTQIFITNIHDTDSPVPVYSNLKVFDLPIVDQPGFSDFKNLFRIFNILKNENVTVIHGHGAKGGIYCRLISSLLSAKSIYTPHGGSLHRVYGALKNRLYSLIEFLLIPFTDLFIFESHYSYETFCSNVCKINDSFLINYNGVDIPPFQATHHYQKGQPLKLASFGLLRHLKGHDIIIEACAMLKMNGIPFEYSIYGSGEQLDFLSSLITEEQLQNHIFFKNYSESVEREMLKFDFIVHPSRFESFGYVPVEAMSVKVPVITSFEGGLKEVVDETCGFIAKDNKASTYFEILKNLYNNSASLEPMIESAYLKVKTKFSKSVMTKKLEKIYLQ